MDGAIKKNIRNLGIFLLITAAVPLLNLLLPVLPDIIRQIAILITVNYPLLCLCALVWGSFIIRQLPCKKCCRWIIFTVWLILYTLLCWSWLIVTIIIMMKIDRL